MKRQSKAEEALAKQITNLRFLLRGEEAKIEQARAKIDVYRETINSFENEIAQLKKAREKASARNSAAGL